jgi:hypothetical protein
VSDSKILRIGWILPGGGIQGLMGKRKSLFADDENLVIQGMGTRT